MRFSNFLKNYDTEDYVLRQKAKFLLIFSYVVVSILFIAIVSTSIISGFQVSVLLPELICFGIIIFATNLLIRGKFNLAAHIIFSVSFLTIWVVVILDPSTVIAKLDTVSYIIGLLAATPVIVSNSKKPLWFYYIINSIILVMISVYFYNSGLISGFEMADLIQDNLIVLSFVFVVAYNLFSINQEAIQQTQDELDERKKAELSAKSLQSLLDNIINSMPSTIIGVNNDGQVIQWNQEAQRITGVSAKKAQGCSLNGVFPELKNEVERIQKVIKSRTIHKNNRVALQVEENERIVNITIFPLVTNGTDGAVIRIDDVTDFVQMEEMMIQSEKMMAVGGLAAGMAHEINNPLAGMLQNAQVVSNRLTRNIPFNEEVAAKHSINLGSLKEYMKERGILDMLDAIKLSGERAAKIIDNMLKFSRRGDTSFQMVDLNQLIDRTLELASNDYDLKKHYDFKKIKILKFYDTSLPNISCMEIRLQQVILNLIKNAAQALSEIEHTTDSAQIHIHTYLDETFAYIEIEDNGPGIPDDIIKHIFEPFFTTKSNKSGTGLGLSISYFIITEDHSGILKAESKDRQGTKFIIQLPRERKEL